MTLNETLDELGMNVEHFSMFPHHHYRRRRRWHRHYPGGAASFLFGLGAGAITVMTLDALQGSYAEKNEEQKMIACGDLPKGIEINKKANGKPDCAKYKDGLICFYEITENAPDACFVDAK